MYEIMTFSSNNIVQKENCSRIRFLFNALSTIDVIEFVHKMETVLHLNFATPL